MIHSILKQSSKLSYGLVAKRFASSGKGGSRQDSGASAAAANKNRGPSTPSKPTNTNTAPNNTASTPSSNAAQAPSEGSFFKNIFSGKSSSSAKSSRTNDEELEIIKEKMNLNEVGTRYSYLLYSIFKDQNALDSLDAEVQKLHDLYESNKAFRDVVDDTNIMSTKQRKEAIEKIIAQAKVSPIMEAFLVIVAENARLTDLPEIISSVSQIKQKLQSDTATIRVISAKALTNEQRGEINNIIKETFPGSGAIEIEESVDPSLGGGWELFYEDKFHLDNSQRTQVNQMHELIENSINTLIGQQSDAASQELAKARQEDVFSRA